MFTNLGAVIVCLHDNRLAATILTPVLFPGFLLIEYEFIAFIEGA